MVLSWAQTLSFQSQMSQGFRFLLTSYGLAPELRRSKGLECRIGPYLSVHEETRDSQGQEVSGPARDLDDAGAIAWPEDVPFCLEASAGERGGN